MLPSFGRRYATWVLYDRLPRTSVRGYCRACLRHASISTQPCQGEEPRQTYESDEDDGCTADIRANGTNENSPRRESWVADDAIEVP
jgi:hypothetical protein